MKWMWRYDFVFFKDIADSLASELEVIVSIPVKGDVADQDVDTINNDNNLKEEIVRTCKMAVIKVEKGSVVLRLVPLTDDACGKLLDQKGQKVAEMLTVLLQHANLQKEIKGKIGVKILVSGKKTEGINFIEILGHLTGWAIAPRSIWYNLNGPFSQNRL